MVIPFTFAPIAIILYPLSTEERIPVRLSCLSSCVCCFLFIVAVNLFGVNIVPFDYIVNQLTQLHVPDCIKC